MASNAWNTVLTFPKISFAADARNSSSFAVPRGTVNMVVSVPTLDNAATYKLQSLDPVDGTTFTDVFSVNVGAGTLSQTAITALASAKANVMDIGVFGGGMLRFVASADQTADKTFSVRFQIVI